MKEKIKPIAILYLPENFRFGADDSIENCVNLMKELNGWGESIKPDYELTKYLWFVFTNPVLITPIIEVKNTSRLSKSEYKRLIERIKQLN